ncbi:MAG: hypothetical protein IJ899_00615 [Blautia sp.]|nr:hypothetical protein [Blautia sp.]MBR2562295.1 hypothetical protein [Eubacterium sp.]
MVTEKLVIKKQTRRPHDNMYRVRVDGDTYEIVEKLAEQTNRSMTDICAKLIRYAYEHSEVQEDEA